MLNSSICIYVRIVFVPLLGGNFAPLGPLCYIFGLETDSRQYFLSNQPMLFLSVRLKSTLRILLVGFSLRQSPWAYPLFYRTASGFHQFCFNQRTAPSLFDAFRSPGLLKLVECWAIYILRTYACIYVLLEVYRMLDQQYVYRLSLFNNFRLLYKCLK